MPPSTSNTRPVTSRDSTLPARPPAVRCSPAPSRRIPFLRGHHVGEDRLGHSGPAPTGDRVDGHADPAHLGGGDRGQCRDTGLGGAVVGLPTLPCNPAPSWCDDARRLPAGLGPGPPVRAGMFHGREVTLEVHGDDGVELFFEVLTNIGRGTILALFTRTSGRQKNRRRSGSGRRPAPQSATLAPLVTASPPAAVIRRPPTTRHCPLTGRRAVQAADVADHRPASAANARGMRVRYRHRRP